MVQQHSPEARQDRLDVRVDLEGGRFLVTPVSEAARSWMAIHLGPDIRWFGGSAAIDTPAIDALVNRMTEQGLVAEGPS
jgi:hypothetical protein